VRDPARPAFFSAELDKSCLGQDENVAIFPWGADANVYQAEAGFRFRVAGGYLTPLIFGERPVIGFNEDPTVVELDYWGDRGTPSPDALRAFAARHEVDRVVSAVGGGYPTKAQMHVFGRVQELGGVYVAPACGEPSLRTAALPASSQLVLKEQAHGATIQWCRDGYVYRLPAGLDPGGVLEGATKAVYVQGHHLRCKAPAGYVEHGYAPTSLRVPPRTYRYYVPA
jgi:hypothetical protein